MLRMILRFIAAVVCAAIIGSTLCSLGVPDLSAGYLACFSYFLFLSMFSGKFGVFLSLGEDKKKDEI